MQVEELTVDGTLCTGDWGTCRVNEVLTLFDEEDLVVRQQGSGTGDAGEVGRLHVWVWCTGVLWGRGRLGLACFGTG